MSDTQTLTDHDAIREWAKARGATPARYRRGPRTKLAFDFRRVGQPALQDLKWNRWFDAFERFRLALLVDNETRSLSDRYELVPRASNRLRTGAARRRRFAPDGNQPVGVRTPAVKDNEEPATGGRQPLRKIVKSMTRRPNPAPGTGTPGPARRRKSRAVPKPIRAPRAPGRG
jgi:hypothetical protein